MEIRSPNGISFPPTPENCRRALQWADCAKGSSSCYRSTGETCDVLDSIPTRRNQRDSGSSHSSQRLVQHDSGSTNSGCTTQSLIQRDENVYVPSSDHSTQRSVQRDMINSGSSSSCTTQRADQGDSVSKDFTQSNGWSLLEGAMYISVKPRPQGTAT